MNLANATYFSVDIETAGPNPSQYSLLAIGACTLGPRTSTFYVEMQPVNKRITPEAYAVHHLDMKRLAERGRPPAIAMASFEDWVLAETPEGSRPVFLAFNAPFDWMFVNDYFYRYLNRNPFGYSALDIKAFYMGLSGVEWHQTSMGEIRALYLQDTQVTHHALRDAVDQAEIFTKMLAEARQRSLPANEAT